jgi:hypothetical protein
MRAWVTAFLLALSTTASAAAAGGGGGAPAPPPPKPGAIAGRVVLAPGIPATACRVTIQGSGSASCNKSGAFIVKEVMPGQYDLQISVTNVGETNLSAGVGDGQTTYLGDVTVGVPGAVMGQITAENSSDLDLTIVGIPELGVYTLPNITGGYLLTGVPAGTWSVILFPPGQSASARTITVPPGLPIRDVDFVIKAAPLPTLKR